MQYKHGMLKHLAREARKQGQHRFWSPKPCKNGHIGYRYVSSWDCVECAYEYHKQYNAEQRARRIEQNAPGP